MIRVHPAEVKLCNQPRRDPVLTDKQRLVTPPADNVTMVGPEDPVNSHVRAAASNVGLVYTSKMGLEMACAGILVVLAAAAHFGRRGCTWDPPTPARTGRPWTVSLPAPMQTMSAARNSVTSTCSSFASAI